MILAGEQIQRRVVDALAVQPVDPEKGGGVAQAGHEGDGPSEFSEAHVCERGQEEGDHALVFGGGDGKEEVVEGHCGFAW